MRKMMIKRRKEDESVNKEAQRKEDKEKEVRHKEKFKAKRRKAWLHLKEKMMIEDMLAVYHLMRTSE
ncbi:hypothetical protein Tco_0875209 [Tanacetum coccineum]|uniref:Uncharacterized protein n=1 Tax=Tanacetum coccineum TaxID=301880 RepID=A0ABQ5BSC0_9ASTR